VRGGELAGAGTGGGFRPGGVNVRSHPQIPPREAEEHRLGLGVANDASTYSITLCSLANKISVKARDAIG
jgi:hypothetical protein